MIEKKVHPYTKQERRLLCNLRPRSLFFLLLRVKQLKEEGKDPLPFDYYLKEVDKNE